MNMMLSAEQENKPRPDPAYIVREAREEDFPAVYSLVTELARYERSAGSVTNNVELMKREKEYFGCFVAETHVGEIIGMALFFTAYYSWVGKSLYLEDIIVREGYRQSGVGTALINAIMKEAEMQGCRRVRWQVLEWNEPAISFYRKCGADISSEWLNCTFDEKGIAAYNRKKAI